MVTNNVNGLIKIAMNHKKNGHLQINVEKSRKKSGKFSKIHSDNNNSKVNNRTIRNNVLSNINSAIFAMLLQRTTFAILCLVLSLSSFREVSAQNVSIFSQSNSNNMTIAFPVFVTPKENKPKPQEEIFYPKPVYIPLNNEPTTHIPVEKISKESNKKYTNTTYKTGNTLWDSFLNECIPNPSISCIQKNVYTYLDDSLGFSGDVNITDGFVFKKNKLAYWKYSKKANSKISRNIDIDTKENEIDNDEDEARYSESPIEEVTDALYDKGVGFMMSHDVELQLPEMIFNGAVLKISPRALEGSGALVHLDLQPKNEVNSNGEGRIFFKKIKKFIRNKILLAILAIVLVVKLIKLKLFFFLPLIIGVHNAKKLFLKLVLFVFPALSHIFKMCSWYHENYHHTKYHHHHHQISHIHHPAFSSPHGGYPPSGVPASAYSPPHTIEYHAGGYSPASLQHDQPPWEFSGPGLGPEYLSANIHRNSPAFNPKVEDMNTIKSWGLGQPEHTVNTATTASFTKPYSAYYDEQRFTRPPAVGDIRNRAATPQGPPYVRTTDINAQIERDALMKAAQRQEQIKLAQAQLLRQQQEQNLQTLSAQDSGTINNVISQDFSPVYDPFYSPILQRVDKVFEGLGFNNETCRERLVCSMYKNPPKFSPHSNILSNEISRDANELVKPAPGSVPALRYFKYVQAARDGQDKRDCHQLYPQCAISTD